MSDDPGNEAASPELHMAIIPASFFLGQISQPLG